MKQVIAILSLVFSTVACTVTFSDDSASAQPVASADSQPRPVPFANREKIAAACHRYGMSYLESNCLLNLKDARIDSEAIDACGGYGMASLVEQCLANMNNKWFAPGIVQLCRGYGMTSLTEQCMGNLADYYYDSYSISACSKYSMTSLRESCVKNLKK